MKNEVKRKGGYSKFVEYVFYIYVAIFPFLSFKGFLYGASSTRSVSLILLGTILGISYAFYILKKEQKLNWIRSPISIAALAYLLMLFISGIIGTDFHTTFWSVATRTAGIWYLLNLFFVTYVLWKFVAEDRNKQDKIILVTIVSTAFYSFLSFLSPEGVNLLFQDYRSDGFTFGNSTFAGMYIFGAFLLSIYYLFRSEKRKWWMYALPPVMLINPNIINALIWKGDISQGIMGEARASTMVILASVLALVLIWSISKIKDFKVRSKISYTIFALGIIVFSLSALSLLSPNGYLRKAYLSQASAVRPLVWEMSEKVIAERPLFGWGGDNFERVFEKNYDNRLLEVRYGNEAWMDRAHNVFMDQAVDNGIIGTVLYVALYIVTAFCLLKIALNSKDKNDRILATILLAYFPMHFIELQTAFDTTISYPMLMIMFALSLALYSRTYHLANHKTVPEYLKYSVSAVLFVFFAWFFFTGWIPFVRAEMANGYVRTIGSSELRVKAYPVLLGSPVDKHAFLWRSSTDFQKAVASDPSVLQDKNKLALLVKEVEYFADEYKKLIKENPKHFRARLNLADMLIYQRLLGKDRLAEAQSVLDEAISMVPQAPQPYWMKSVAYLYMRKFDLAKEYAKKSLDLNPDADQSQALVRYIDKSVKTFPDIELYFFRQI